jgi:hypothetical protein
MSHPERRACRYCGDGTDATRCIQCESSRIAKRLSCRDTKLGETGQHARCVRGRSDYRTLETCELLRRRARATSKLRQGAGKGPVAPFASLVTFGVHLAFEGARLGARRRSAKDIEVGDSEGRRMVRTVPVRTKAGPVAASTGSARVEPPPARRESPSADPASFDALLRRTVELSRKEHDEKVGSLEALAALLRELPPEARSKLRVVMTAGRDGVSLSSAHASVSAAPPGLGASELESAGGALGDYLARGHAIACATQFQLDVSLERWSGSESGELEERVWLRFGKQLAASPPEEWECLGAVGASDRLTQLYLRLGKAVWWSFGAVLDRPSPEMVRKDGRGRSGRHSKLGLLRKVAERRCEPDRRALRRALRAIRARTGKPLDG